MDKLTILLVDDEETILSTLENILSKFFNEVITATNGKEGIDQYLQYKNDIDLILADIRMPVMGGLEMISEIKKVDEQLPTYVISGEHNAREEAFSLGVNEFFNKPLMFDNLFDKIKSDFKL